MMRNLFADLSSHLPGELFTTLLQAADVRVERIVSHGHVSPTDFWNDQAEHEWVIVLKGEAILLFKNQNEPLHLKCGDHILIPAHQKHRVQWTTPVEPTVWLAVFYQTDNEYRKQKGMVSRSRHHSIASYSGIPRDAVDVQFLLLANQTTSEHYDHIRPPHSSAFWYSAFHPRCRNHVSRCDCGLVFRRFPMEPAQWQDCRHRIHVHTSAFRAGHYSYPCHRRKR